MTNSMSYIYALKLSTFDCELKCAYINETVSVVQIYCSSAVAGHYKRGEAVDEFEFRSLN